MRLDITVTVQNKTTTYDSEGMSVETWTASQTTELSNKQPLSGEIAFAEYGITDAEIRNLFFFKTSTAAQENGRVVYGSEIYDIYRIDKYPNHYEVIVRPVVS
jgi:hypothetical protein